MKIILKNMYIKLLIKDCARDELLLKNKQTNKTPLSLRRLEYLVLCFYIKDSNFGYHV